MPESHARRRGALRKNLATEGYDALLVSSPVNVRYLTRLHRRQHVPLIVTAG